MKDGSKNSSAASDITQKVFAALAAVKHIPAESISLESSLADLGFDSLDKISLLFELEQQFDISIPDEDVRGIETAGDVVAGIVKLLADSSRVGS